MKAADLKLIVQQKYGEIAKQSVLINPKPSCCGETSSCCGNVDYTMFSDNYSGKEGYNPEADLGLGCGLPTEFADIKQGNHVLDLGSGAGNDCFVARALVGDTGKVTGLDFTDDMLERARRNNEKMGYSNVEFVKGDIENMPLPDSTFDVVISNCVLNLVPDKEKAFAQIFSVLKPDGHFCISDVVLTGKLPAKIQEAAEMYAGCVAGAIQKTEYIQIVRRSGFFDIQIKKEKQIIIPDSVLANFLSSDELEDFKRSEAGIFSITVTGSKHSN